MSAVAARPGRDRSPADADVSTVDACDSTNAALLARVRAARLDRPAVLRARRQTAGRGRHGKAWHMEPAASLAFSIAWPVLRPPAALSLAVGAALADALDPPAAGVAPRIRLKWPNDLQLADGRKLAGLLVEAAPDAVVVGVGLNVRPLAVPGRDDVGALSAIEPDATPDRVFEALWPRLLEALAAFDARGFDAAFADRFAARDALLGRTVRATVAGGAIEGPAAGVDADGALLVRTDGGTRRVTSGEVLALRPVAAEAAP